jgi:ABC-2 type transport system permease protein
MNARAKFYWSVRRELWEHRAIYFAPLAVAGLVLVAFLFNTRRIAETMRALPSLEPAKQLAAIETPYNIAASAILFTSFIVAMFYCLDALYGERRDRSILFWKSMPVSDLTTIVSKAFIPLAVLPLVAFAIALATQGILLMLTSVVLMVDGVDLATLWSRLSLQMPLTMLYGVITHVLWYAPIYGWLLLVSAWAKKAPFLWAVLPVLAAMAFEKIAFGTTYVASLAQYRIAGAMREAFAADAWKEPISQLSQLAPAKFLSTPGLWAGLAVAVAFLAAAVWLRRRREPI